VVLVDGTAQLIGVATLAGMTGYLDPHLGWFPGAAPAVSTGLAGTLPAGVTLTAATVATIATKENLDMIV